MGFTPKDANPSRGGTGGWLWEGMALHEFATDAFQLKTGN